MKHIKTPINREGYYLEEADGRALAQVFYGAIETDLRTAPQAIDAAREIERAVNSFDALLAACRLAKEHLDAMRLESGMGNVMLSFERTAFEQVDNVLTAAIAAAEGESGAQ